MKTREQIETELRQTNPFTFIGDKRVSNGDTEYEALIAEWTNNMVAHQERVAQKQLRPNARAALRAQYMALPPYIRGPMMRDFIAATQLLDLGLDEDAAAIIEYSEPPNKFNDAKKQEFESIRQSFIASIATLPPLV